MNGNLQPYLECLVSKERGTFIHRTCHRINPVLERPQMYSSVELIVV